MYIKFKFNIKMNFNKLYEMLPMDICILIGEYNYEHRNYMRFLMDELLYEYNYKYHFYKHRDYMIDIFDELYGYYYDNRINNYTICDNYEQCSNVYQKESGVLLNIGVITPKNYTFCCKNCSNYGEWSILYDERRELRRLNNWEQGWTDHY